MIEHVRSALDEAAQALDQLRQNNVMLTRVAAAGSLFAEALRDGHKAYSCGNGGSLCDAMHFAEELSGRFRQNRPALAATAISDPAHMSCTANDYGYDDVYSRYLEAHGRKGDVLLAISTSGTSRNIVKAATRAKELGVKVVALTGKPNTPLGALADIDITTPGGRFADRVQELHIKVIHILIELIERNLYPENHRA